jgi:hypothetical protein
MMKTELYMMITIKHKNVVSYINSYLRGMEGGGRRGGEEEGGGRGGEEERRREERGGREEGGRLNYT